jgi:hypothetical protein
MSLPVLRLDRKLLPTRVKLVAECFWWRSGRI